MKENIETKDVQRTEYLDKNGLDMLWAKVKENTRNLVEVEYNRAKAKEDSLSQEIASAKPAEGKSYILAKLTSKEQDGDECYYDVAGDISFKSEYSDSYGGPITCINKNGIGITFDNDPTFGSTGLLHVKKNNSYNITMLGRGRLLHDTRDTFNEVSIKLLEDADTTYANSNGGNSMLISQLGIFYTSLNYALTSNDLLTGHGGYKTIGTDIAPLENGKVPAEYLDLSLIDTSDFVSKTTTDAQSLKSELSVSNVLSVIGSSRSEPIVMLGTNDVKPYLVMMNPENEKQVIQVTPTYILIGKHLEDSIVISNYGIQSPDNNLQHVFTTAGSTADLFEYVRKENIGDGLNINDDGVISVDTTAISGGNIDDVQVNGVTVVENKIANIKPATKENLGVVKVGDGLNVTDGTISVDSTAIGAGNYIPYESIAADGVFNPKTYVMKHNEGILFDSSSGDISIKDGEINLKRTERKLSLTPGFIWLQEISNNGKRETLLFELNERGLRLRDGDNNHVLTSYGDTIDIREYALKSVYNKKIAALEARIAALEAKHAETS